MHLRGRHAPHEQILLPTLLPPQTMQQLRRREAENFESVSHESAVVRTMGPAPICGHGVPVSISDTSTIQAKNSSRQAAPGAWKKRKLTKIGSYVFRQVTRASFILFTRWTDGPLVRTIYPIITSTALISKHGAAASEQPHHPWSLVPNDPAPSSVWGSRTCLFDSGISLLQFLRSIDGVRSAER